MSGRKRQRSSEPRKETESAGSAAVAAAPTNTTQISTRPVALAPTKGWELLGGTAVRVVNAKGESYKITRVENGYTFELTIPSAQPGELNFWTPNVKINTKNTDGSVDGMHLMPYIDFDNLIPLDYQAHVCRTRQLDPDADACVAKRKRKEGNTMFLWVPTMSEMPKLKEIFDLLAQGKVIHVEYLFPHERKVAEFVTVGGADVRQILTR